MNPHAAAGLGRRFVELPRERRRLFLDALRAEGVDFALFPIVADAASPERALASYAQRRMWFLWQLDPEGAAYHLPCAIRLLGPLDERALAASFDSLLARHETLRTVFPAADGGGPRPAPAPFSPAIERRDLRALAPQDRDREVRAAAERQAAQPFDLAQGPLLRVELLVLGAEEHVLLLCLHHIVADGWSMNLLIDELGRCYRAHAAGQEPSLPPLPIQYADYALWQRSWMEAGERERQLAYWKQALGSSQPVLELPTDRPRPATPSFRGARHSFILDAQLTQRLRAFARSRQLTLFTLLLGAFDVLLYRHSGQTDLRVGVPVANRHRIETEGLIGCLVNTQVLRAQLDGELRVDAFLDTLKETVLAAQAHQDLPFEQLVEALQPERSLAHNPLFQVLYNHQAQVADLDSLAIADGLRLEPVEWQSRSTQFDLSLDTFERGGELHAAWTYATDLFEPATVERLGRHWLRLLEQMIEAPARRIGELALLGDDERAALQAWNDTTETYPENEGLHRAFERQAAATPQRIALYCGDATLSYAELDARASQLAQRLCEMGVGPEVRVGIAAARDAQLVIGLLAILKAGGAYVPIDPEYPSARIAYLLQDSGVRLLLTQSALLDALPIAPELDTLCLDRMDEQGAEAALPARAPHPDQLAYLIYTSGSTGRPKGVAITHRSAAALIHWSRSAYAAEDLDGVLASTSVCFDLSVWELFVPLSVGGSVVLARNALELPELPARAKVRLVNTVPSAIAALARSGGIPASVRTINLAGEPLRQTLVDELYALPGVQRVHDLYGPSEDTTYSTATLRVAGGRADIGRPIANTVAHLLDDALQPVPVGVAAELYLGGAGLARGYLQRPALTAERFVPDAAGAAGARLYRSGDLLRRRDDGRLEYIGRIDHQVKIRGFRIELGEIESRLQAHAQLRDVAVLARELAGSPQLVAYVVPRDAADAADAPALRERLRGWLQMTLPDYMVPAFWVVLPQLPLTANGKLDRQALPLPDVDAQRGEYVAPRTPAECALASIWAALLPVARIGLDDNFFELGGDSIVSIQVVGRAREAGLQLSPRDLFRHQTVRELAAAAVPVVADAQVDAPAQPLVTLSEAQRAALPLAADAIEDIYPLSPMQQGMLMHTLLEPHSGIYYMQDRYSIDTDVDVARFTAAWNAVVRRHDVLRASFHVDADGHMLQLIHRHAPPRIDVHDWSAMSAEQQDRELETLLAREREQGFDLLHTPPLRLCLIHRGGGRYGFVLSNHHILIDDWCRSLLMEDFFAYYEDRPPLAPAPRYRDFIAWLQAQGSEAARAAWCAELQDVEQRTPLPFDRLPTRARGASQIADRLDRLDPASGARLGRLARQAQLTINTFVQAAWALVLHRYSGLDDVLFGTTVAGRPVSQPQMQRTVGLFVNSIALRVRLPRPDTDIGVAQWLQQLLAHNLALREHEHLPLVEIQACSGVDKGQALFDSLLVYENAPMEREVLDEARRFDARGDSTRTHTNYPLTVVVYPGDALGLHLSYDRRYFDDDTIERLGDEFKRLLVALIEGFEGRYAELPLAPPQALAAVRAQADAMRRAYPLDHGYARLFERAVDAHPQRIAVAAASGQCDYRGLDAQANRIAHALRDRGLQPDRLVALFAERGLDFPGAVIGIFKAGGAYLPLDPHLPDERLLQLLSSARAPLLLCDDACAARAQALLAGIAPALRPQLLTLAQAATHADASRPAIDTGPHHLAYAIYTSGSTGTPKGVMVEQAGMLNNQLSKLPYLELDEGDVIAQTAATSFDISVWQLLTAQLCGACVDVVPDAVARDPLALRRHVAGRGITVLEIVPSLIQACLDATPAAEEGEGWGRLRWLLATGEALTPELARRWRRRYPRIGLVNAYGPAECSDDVALARIDTVPEHGLRLSVGSATDNNRVDVLDAALRPVPRGALGEICVAGVGVGRGYLDKPALTAERFVPDPFTDDGGRLYRTGDLARYGVDDGIEYAGRIDHQVKIRGFRIELGEIESRLQSQPQVRESVVLAQETAHGRQLVGYVVPQQAVENEAGLREALRTQLKSQLPDYMVPTLWVFLEHLPLTPNGKLDRRALPQPDAQSQRRDYVAPRTELESTLAGIWAEVLQVAQVGLADNFFELGGHSLLATQVVSRVRQRCAREVPLRALFETADLEGFAHSVSERNDADAQPPLRVVDRSQPLPLSYAQQRQWFLWQLQPDSSAYTLPAVLRLDGRVDAERLQACFSGLIARHEALRTRFVYAGGMPLQCIEAPAAFALARIDLSGAGETALRAQVDAEIRRPFDLQAGPLLRAALLRSAPDSQLLVVSMHHIVADGWSMQVMVDELLAAYRAGEEAMVSAPAIQYADYALWQRQWMEAGERERQLAYWMAQLGGEQPLLELPLDRPRPAQRSDRGARLELALQADLAAGLRGLARRENVTLFMLLLASFQALLHRLSGQSDIRVGTPVANRQRAETERLIGFFANTLVIKAGFDTQLRFGDLLQQVRRQVLDAQAHQDLPFEMLVDALKPERSLSHEPLFQVMLNHQVERDIADAARIELPELAISRLDWDAGSAQFDLVLNTSESSSGLQAALIYASDLFDATTVERIGRYWQRLLQAVVDDTGLRMNELPLLDAAERERQLRDWNATDAPVPESCVHELIAQRAALTPDAVAVAFGDTTLSYAELDARANRLAHRLRALGVGGETLVGISAHRSLELVVGLLAVLKTGGAYVPVDPEYPRERIAYLLQDSGVGLLLTQSALLDELPLPEGVQALCLDREQTYSDDTSALDVTVHPEQLAYVIYTSGSTGRPKGAGNRHRSLMNRLWWMQRAYELNDADVVLQKTPFGFDVSVWEFFWPLMTGAKLVLAQPGEHREPARLIETIRRHGVTTLHFVPSMLQVFLQDDQVSSCTSLKRIVCSGEALSVESQRQVFAQLPQASLYNLYGPTEAAIDVTHWSCVEENRSSVPIGHPIDNLRTYVLDGGLALLPTGAAGELYLGGVGLARGYLNRAALTAERFVPDPFGDGQRLYRTGDLARHRADGTLEYAGRIDHQVKIRGFRIELGEIEARLLERAEVREAAVLAQDLANGPQLVAYVVADASDATDEAAVRDALRAHLQSLLPDYMVPAWWVLLAQLPLTPNGKLDRRALPAPDAQAQRRDYVAPRTDLEAALAGIWAEVLQVERVGVGDNFFELGGHSLGAVRVSATIRERREVEVPVRELLAAADLADYAQRVDSLERARHPADLELAESLQQLERLSAEELEKLIA